MSWKKKLLWVLVINLFFANYGYSSNFDLPTMYKTIDELELACKDNYGSGNTPIKGFDSSNIGRFNITGKTAIIVFDGSKKSGALFGSCRSRNATYSKTDLFMERDLLAGKCQNGYCDAIEQEAFVVYQQLVSQLSSNHTKEINLKDYEFYIAGHSRGGGLASLFALYLYEMTKNANIRLLTFGAVALFDDSAAVDFRVKSKNFKYQMHFRAIEDLIAQILDGYGLFLLPTTPAQEEVFSAQKEVFGYKTRVLRKAFTRMNQKYRQILIQSLVSFLVKVIPPIDLDGMSIRADLLTIECWEAHAVETYVEFAKTFLRKHSSSGLFLTDNKNSFAKISSSSGSSSLSSYVPYSFPSSYVPYSSSSSSSSSSQYAYAYSSSSSSSSGGVQMAGSDVLGSAFGGLGKKLGGRQGEAIGECIGGILGLALTQSRSSDDDEEGDRNGCPTQ